MITLFLLLKIINQNIKKNLKTFCAYKLHRSFFFKWDTGWDFRNSFSILKFLIQFNINSLLKTIARIIKLNVTNECVCVKKWICWLTKQKVWYEMERREGVENKILKWHRMTVWLTDYLPICVCVCLLPCVSVRCVCVCWVMYVYVKILSVVSVCLVYSVCCVYC